MLVWIILILGFVASIMIVNGVQRAYMKFIGADAMFFSGKAKVIAVVIVALVLSAIVINLLGIQVPS